MTAMLRGARVTVVFPPVNVSPDFIDYPYFADLGAVQAAGTLRAAGADVTLIDAFALPGSTLARREGGGVTGSDLMLGASEADVLSKVPVSTDVFVVALTPFHRPPGRDPSLGGVLSGLRRAHSNTGILLADLYQSGQHVVDAASGDIAASYPEIDALLRYEAEADLPGIVADLAAIGHLATGHLGSARLLTGVEPPKLEALAMPAWDLVDFPAYFAFHERVTARLGRPSWAFPITGRSAPVVTSRGCPYRCVHCSSNPSTRRDGVQIAPKTQRRYPAEYLDRLFGDLASRGVRRVHLLDELLNVNEAHFDAVLDLLRKHRLAFEIPNGLRADYVLPRHLTKMRGQLTTLSVSAESGVQEVVDNIVDKQLDLGAIRTVAEDARAAKVPLLVHFMIGLPGETRDDIQGTLAFALDLAEKHGALPSMQFATPLPGTRLARWTGGAEELSMKASRGERTSEEAPGGEAESTRTAANEGDPRRALPVVKDWGPLFQKRPVGATGQFTPEYLSAARRMFDRRMEALRAPSRARVHLTYRCNNRCSFCTTGDPALAAEAPPDIRESLVACRKLGATALDIDGGEPTVSDRLFPAIAFARKVGYSDIHVTTNGRMAAYPAFAERLVASGVTAISVTLNGPDAATHDAIVGAEGAFAQTVSGIEHLLGSTAKGAGKPHVDVGVKVTLTRHNQDKLHAIAALAESLGVRRLDVLFLTPFGPTTPEIAPAVDTAAREVERTIQAFRGRLDVRVENLPFCLLPGHEEHVTGDIADLAGRRIHVDGAAEPTRYLRERRVRREACATCPHVLGCRGFFEMDAAPAPDWLRPKKRSLV